MTKSASDSPEGFEDDSVFFYRVKLLLVLLLILSFLWVSDNNGLVLWVRCNVIAIINNIDSIDMIVADLFLIPINKKCEHLT